jgi:hypothetical protein
MAKHIKNIEQVYDLLIVCRKIFKDLNGDTIASLNKMSRLCKEIDNVVEEYNEEEHE